MSAIVGLSPMRNSRTFSRLLTIARLPSIRSLRNASTAGSPAGLAKFFKNRNGPRKTLTFWFAFAAASDEVGQDDARLRKFPFTVNKDRRFAHFIDFGAKFRRALDH